MICEPRNNLTRALVAVIWGSVIGPIAASAGEPAACLSWSRLVDGMAGRCLCACPDDYRPKCLPKVVGECDGCGNDYCPKPPPCVYSTSYGCCDDYCPKPWRPVPWCPPCVYRCVPGGCPPR